jgi:hypothetical protein
MRGRERGRQRSIGELRHGDAVERDVEAGTRIPLSPAHAVHTGRFRAMVYTHDAMRTPNDGRRGGVSRTQELT